MNDPERDDFGLVIDPAPREWSTRVRDFFRPGDAARGAVRRRLGLPTDRPIIMTGHQAIVWHPGILAKYFAAESAARAIGGASAWLVVDQDSEDPWQVRYPGVDVQGRAVVERLAFPPNGFLADTPAMSLPARAPLPVRGPWLGMTPSVDAGLTRIHALFGAHAIAPNAGRQLARVLADLLNPLAPAATLFAGDLACDPEFGRLLDGLASEAEADRCVRAYNAAVARHPEAGLRPLVHDAVNVRYELPVWRTEFGRPRRRVYAEDLDGLPRANLAPRALLMTAFLRRFACDLFIHGTGGGVYDRVTEEWLAAWTPGAAMAPTAVVTATLRLEIDTGGVVGPRELATAQWTAHHARHDPAVLGEPAAAEAKAALVMRIAHDKLEGRGPASAYREMHALLADVRARRASELHALESRVAEVEDRVRRRELADDRTWAFPLYPPERLAELAREIDGRFADGAG